VAWFGVAGDLAIITALTARADQIQFEEPDPLIDQAAYALWDCSLVWTAADWQVGLHGKNLADKEYKVAGLNIYDLGFENNVTAFYGNPRQFWLDLRYRFH
jgi:iron complex outermembrane receptor protein